SNLVIRGGIRGKPRRIGSQQNPYIDARIRQVSCDHETVAAVIAAAAQDQVHAGSASSELREDSLRGAAPGVFHQNNPGDREFFDGAAVDLADLRACQWPN